MVTGEVSMSTPINEFKDIFDAMERDPVLRDALRRHILTEELLQVPARLVRIEDDVTTLKEGQARLEEDVRGLKEGQEKLEEGQERLTGDVREMRGDLQRFGGRLSNLTGDQYETHVAEYIHRILRRSLAIHASVFSTQRDKTSLTRLLDLAESQGLIEDVETDQLDKTDLVMTIDNSPDYIVAEISVTIQQDDVDRAAKRAGLLAKATGYSVTPLAIGAREEPNLTMGEVHVVLIREPSEQAQAT